MRKRLILAVLLLLCALLPANQTTALDGWVGVYQYDEYCPPNICMSYSIIVSRAGDHYFADIEILGFQTWLYLRADVKGDENTVDFYLFEYLPSGIGEPYEKGERLFGFQKRGSELVTRWGAVEPIDLEAHPESVCFTPVQPPCIPAD